MGMIRLDKFLADMSLGTRSEVKKEIKKRVCSGKRYDREKSRV